MSNEKALQRRLRKEETVLVVDHSTGEIVSQTSRKRYSYRNGANYYKVFFEHPLFTQDIPKSCRVLLFALASYIPYADRTPYIRVMKKEIQEISEKNNISITSVKRGLTILCDKNLLFRVDRGLYFVNPHVISRGRSSDILETQEQWDVLVGHTSDTVEK